MFTQWYLQISSSVRIRVYILHQREASLERTSSPNLSPSLLVFAINTAHRFASQQHFISKLIHLLLVNLLIRCLPRFHQQWDTTRYSPPRDTTYVLCHTPSFLPKVPRKPLHPNKAPSDGNTPCVPAALDSRAPPNYSTLMLKSDEELRAMLAAIHPVWAMVVIQTHLSMLMCTAYHTHIPPQLCNFGKMGRPSYAAIQQRGRYTAVQQELKRRGLRCLMVTHVMHARDGCCSLHKTLSKSLYTPSDTSTPTSPRACHPPQQYIMDTHQQSNIWSNKPRGHDHALVHCNCCSCDGWYVMGWVYWLCM